MQLDPIKPKLKPPRTKRLKLESNMLLSTSAFKCNLCRYNTVRVRPKTVTVEGFTLGNPPTADFASPFLVSMREVRVECNPLSLAGVRGRGNFVMGWLAGEIRLMAAGPSHHNSPTCT